MVVPAVGGLTAAMPGQRSTFDNCLFDLNGSWNGGALYAPTGAALFTNCRFISNQGWQVGGAAFVGGEGSVDFATCEFSQNSSGSGGAMYDSSGARPTQVSGCMFDHNVAGNDGGAVVAPRCAGLVRPLRQALGPRGGRPAERGECDECGQRGFQSGA